MQTGKGEKKVHGRWKGQGKGGIDNGREKSIKWCCAEMLDQGGSGSGGQTYLCSFLYGVLYRYCVKTVLSKTFM